MEKEVKEMETTISVLGKSLDNANERNRFKDRALVLFIIILLAINGYFAYQFTTTTNMTTTETTTTQEGAYNFYDSEGNMISSDLSLEEMQELIDLNEVLE